MKKELVKRLLRTHQVFCLVRNNSTKSVDNFLKFYSEQNCVTNKYRVLTGQDYVRFISKKNSLREPALTRLLAALACKMDKQAISLAEGVPNEGVFPYTRLQMDTRDGRGLVIEGKDMAVALQYTPSQGLPALLTEIRQFQHDLHRPPPIPRDVMVTNGSQQGIYQCIELLVEPGDPVMKSEYSYPGINVALKPYQPEIVNISEDYDGLVPESLESTLEDRLVRGLKMPKLLYVTPTGSNPAGTVIPEERRKKIYDLACRYDFLILEDDAYMFLNYDEVHPPSFLSLDTCGRVIRLDSFSKVISAGLRAAWVTAPTALLQRLELHMQAEMLHSCTLSQAILLRLLSHRPSLVSYLQNARALYRRRRDALQGRLEAHLRPLADWCTPRAGLFIWLRVHNVDDVYNMVFQTAFERGLILIPGNAFQYDTSAPCQYLRLTFSKISFEDMDIAARHLADIIRDEQRRTLHKEPQRLATER
ncbi:kynurenine/alpha-aminoadipate aminotransferase, mitochondrial [Galleria mellonella]|uniref:Kynurenine/alpha-aminoadipate aminotransferase, mitochondrial n=1 Tax=Galleria mellonella TaxID=7137 RepID=A0ABM3N399_GALME|nr:kynurenine/alpha-aminoadipate aminotransferase, mitochondrial [Galleria mellonella]